MKIYAIIVTYNAMRRGWIDRCLGSLAESTVPVTAIVVDNLSTDGTREHVPSRWPDAVWLPQERNLGFGQANNVGMRYALEHDADYVLLLNQDAAIAPDALAEMANAAKGQKVLLSPMQLNGDGTSIDQMFRNVLHMADNGLLEDFIIRHEAKATYPTGIFAAACWLMPADMLREVGGFNPLFFHYGEDDNYQSRTRYHGYCNIVVTKAMMYHDREEHGNVKVFNKNKMRRELLVTVCDINKSAAGTILSMLNLLYKCYTYRLPRQQYRPGTFLPAVLWLMGHCGAIAKSRKKEKSKGRNWL